ncbi:TPA: hypothetical protein ACH3X1_000250 [Trebouxia sp. C0004]
MCLIAKVSPYQYPGLMTRHWFQHMNAFSLRKHIRSIICHLCLEQMQPGNRCLTNMQTWLQHYGNQWQPKYLSAHAYLPFAKEAEQHRAKALVAVKSLQKQPLDEVVDLT